MTARRQWNSTLPAPTKRLSRSPIQRGGRIAPTKRTPSEFARIYGSRARVRWVKSLPCVVCVAVHPLLALGCGPSDNAHTETGGTGRKAGHRTIAPLCRPHHRRFDEHQAPCDTVAVRQAVQDAARVVAETWDGMVARG